MIFPYKIPHSSHFSHYTTKRGGEGFASTQKYQISPVLYFILRYYLLKKLVINVCPARISFSTLISFLMIVWVFFNRRNINITSSESIFSLSSKAVISLEIEILRCCICTHFWQSVPFLKMRLVVESRCSVSCSGVYRRWSYGAELQLI